MPLALGYATSVNFSEPTPACSIAARRSTFRRACLNLRRQAWRHGSKSPDRLTNAQTAFCRLFFPGVVSGAELHGLELLCFFLFFVF